MWSICHQIGIERARIDESLSINSLQSHWRRWETFDDVIKLQLSRSKWNSVPKLWVLGMRVNEVRGRRHRHSREEHRRKTKMRDAFSKICVNIASNGVGAKKSVRFLFKRGSNWLRMHFQNKDPAMIQPDHVFDYFKMRSRSVNWTITKAFLALLRLVANFLSHLSSKSRWMNLLWAFLAHPK